MISYYYRLKTSVRYHDDAVLCSLISISKGDYMQSFFIQWKKNLTVRLRKSM